MAKTGSRRLICFDPGVSTGVASFVNGELHYAGVVGALREVWEFLDKHNPQEVVCESFKLFPGAASNKIWSDFPTVQRIGTIKTWCELHDVPYSEQSPSMAKQGCPDSKLRKLGWLQKNRHANDAIRHGVVYLRRNSR